MYANRGLGVLLCLQAVLKEVSDSNGKIVLFIDEIHTVVGAGATGGAMDAGGWTYQNRTNSTLLCLHLLRCCVSIWGGGGRKRRQYGCRLVTQLYPKPVRSSMHSLVTVAWSMLFQGIAHTCEGEW
jgi:hypothetical protein